jgi:hypothetical protein
MRRHNMRRVPFVGNQPRRYSITSSARPSNVYGSVKPSALAVLRLMTLEPRRLLDRDIGRLGAL